MSDIREHYESLLADHYSWLFGGFEMKAAENEIFFAAYEITPHGNRRAIDLGSGSGFQSIALARMGFEVIAIDLSPKLLAELNRRRDGLSITTVEDDLLNFTDHLQGKAELCVCMGDTLTHLDSRETVEKLCRQVFAALEANGRFVLTFRDLTPALDGLDRFIPVKSDEDKIFTCFLEYESEHVKVHDLVYEKAESGWNLKKSFYRKCRIALASIKEIMTVIGFRLDVSTLDKGVITIIATKY
jgi:SAM-dependent methyltransferase